MDKEYCKVTVQWEGSSSSKLSAGAASGSSETRILAFYGDRLEVLGLQSKTQQLRSERRVPYLDLRGIRMFATAGQSSRMQLTLASGDWLQFGCSLPADCARIVGHIVGCLYCYLPQLAAQVSLLELTLPADFQVEALVAEHSPPDLLQRCRSHADKCGQFCSAYDLYCAYTGATVQDEIKWDVDTIYFSLGTKAFCLADFSHFGQADFTAVIGALAFNDHFETLNCSGVKFSPAMAKSTEFLLTFNSNLRELLLSNCGLKGDFIKAFASGIVKNKSIGLTALDLSNNSIDEKHVASQSQLLKKLSPSLERLNLAHCGLSVKLLNQVFECLDHLQAPCPLRQLTIDSGVQKSQSECSAIFGYLENATNLEELSCSNCGFLLNALAPTLLRLSHCLTQLDLSGNQFWPEQHSHHGIFTGRRRPSRSHDAQPSIGEAIEKAWGKFFADCTSLRRVCLNRCRLPPAAANDLLVGLSSNRHLPAASLCLELAGNDFGPAGAQVLCSCFDNNAVQCLESLDMADNDFGDQVNRVVESVCKSGSIRHLAIGGSNFSGRDTTSTTVQEFSELVTDSKCCLESLSIRGARLEHSLNVLLNSLGQCKNLLRLDISDNAMSDLGAKVLAKALHLNCSLAELRLDGNKLGPNGLRELADALKSNASLCRLPVPVADIARAAAGSSQSVGAIQTALDLIQDGLLRNNHGTGYQASSRDYRLHSELSSFAFTANTYVDQMRVNLSAVSAAAAEAGADVQVAACLERCRVAMADAESAKCLLIELSKADADRDTRRCLGTELPAPVQAALGADLAAVQSAMLHEAEAACPGAFAADCRLGQTLLAGLANDSRCQIAGADVAEVLARSVGSAMKSRLS